MSFLEVVALIIEQVALVRFDGVSIIAPQGRTLFTPFRFFRIREPNRWSTSFGLGLFSLFSLFSLSGNSRKSPRLFGRFGIRAPLGDSLNLLAYLLARRATFRGRRA
ncbi:MAG: hypothetical protein ACRD1X_21960 [Vicinamibacteria bacterium]